MSTITGQANQMQRATNALNQSQLIAASSSSPQKTFINYSGGGRKKY